MTKVCVFGAGAIGSHLGARLALGGARVSVVARGEQLAAIRARGITLLTPKGEQRLMVQAESDPQRLGEQDVVIVTVKAPALVQAAPALQPLLGRQTPVVFVVNGIPWWYARSLGAELPNGSAFAQANHRIADAVAIDRVIGGVVMSPAEIVAPGVVRVRGLAPKLIVGETDGASTPRVQRIAGLLERGGLRTEVSADIRTAVWDKLVSNLMTGPLSVLARSTYRDVLAVPACEAAALAIGNEVVRVARAFGSAPQPDIQRRLEAVRGLTHRPSILQDLEAGRAMEVDVLLEAPRLLAQAAGVAVPTLDLLASLATLVARRSGLYAS